MTTKPRIRKAAPEPCKVWDCISPKYHACGWSPKGAYAVWAEQMRKWGQI